MFNECNVWKGKTLNEGKKSCRDVTWKTTNLIECNILNKACIDFNAQNHLMFHVEIAFFLLYDWVKGPHSLGLKRHLLLWHAHHSQAIHFQVVLKNTLVQKQKQMNLDTNATRDNATSFDANTYENYLLIYCTFDTKLSKWQLARTQINWAYCDLISWHLISSKCGRVDIMA